jgi:hypothetical protein
MYFVHIVISLAVLTAPVILALLIFKAPKGILRRFDARLRENAEANFRRRKLRHLIQEARALKLAPIMIPKEDDSRSC